MKRILVAEDNKLILETISHKLLRDGFEVIKVNDGKECLDYVKSNEIDLLITDLFMPYVNGHEVVSPSERVQTQSSDLGLIGCGS
jgi:CheY-like chemotaxis protein